MKVSICCILIAVISLFSGVTCEGKHLTVGIFDNPPGTYYENGKPKGFWVDILNRISREEDWNLDYYHCSGWSDCLTKIKDGEIDINTQTAYIKEREEFLDYSKESLLLNWTTLLQRKSENINKLQDLEGHKIVILKDDYNSMTFKKFIDSTTIKVEYLEISGNPRDVIKVLLDDESVKAAVINSLTGLSASKEYPVKETPIILNPFTSHFVVPKGRNKGVLEAIDYNIRRWKQDKGSAYYDIYDKYYGRDILEGHLHKGPNIHVIYFLVSILILVFVLIARYYKKFRSPAVISLIYLIFGSAWILTTDYFVEHFISDLITEQIQTYKGLIYVLITSILIFELTRQSIKRLGLSEQKYKETIESIPHGITEVTKDGIINMSNHRFHEMFGFKYPELIGKRIWDLLDGEDLSNVQRDFLESRDGDIEPYIWEGSFKTKMGRHTNIEVDWTWRKDISGKPSRMVAVITDVTEKTKNKKRQIIANQILSYLNRDEDTAETVKKCLTLIKETFYINVAAIRLDKGQDFAATALRIKVDKGFPYFAANGLSEKHLDHEHHCLISLDKTVDRESPVYRCLCGSVISKTYNFSKDNFTDYGSFWTDDLASFISSLSGDTKSEVEFHSHCLDAGYRSISLIPLKVKDDIVGVLQLCDRRTGAFDLETIKYFEGLADSISIAFDRRWAYQQLKINEQTLKSLFDAAPAGVGIVELPNRIVRKINPYIESMLLKPAEDIIDFPARNLYPDDETYSLVGRDKHALVEKYGVGSVETQWIRSDGKLIDIILSSAKIGDSNNLVFTAIDITDKKETENKLRSSEFKYRNLFDNMLDGFALHEIILNDNGDAIDYRYITVNPAFEKITGLTKEQVEGKTVKEVLPNVEHKWIDEFGKVAITGESSHFESRAIDLDGRYFEVTAYSTRKNQFAVLFQDVTERHAAQEQLRRFEMIVSTSIDMMSFIDKNKVYLAVNHVYEKYHGIPVNEIIGKSIDDIVGDKNAREIAHYNIDKALQGKPSFFEAEINFAKKGRRTVEIQYHPYYGESETVEGVVVNARDVTERKRFETRLARVFESAPLGLGIANFERQFQFFNSLFSNMLGYSVEELKGKSTRIIYPDDVEYDKVGKLYSTETFLESGFDMVETALINKDGAKFPALLGLSKVPNFDEVVFSVVDITDQKQKELEIVRRKNQFDKLITSLFDGFTRVSKDGVIIFANEAFLKIIGYTKEELSTFSIEDITHPDDYSWEKTLFEEMILSGKIIPPYEKRYIHKDSQVVPVEIAPYAIPNSEGNIIEIWGMVRDLTPVKDAERQVLEKEQQLRRAVKMEAVGTLAGGIAHDFNNILQIIGGNVQLMALDEEDDNIIEQYRVLSQAVERGASLVRSLLTFSRKVESKLKPVNLNDVITVTHKLLDRVAVGPVKIDLELLLDVNIDRVMADSSQIDQVITNLVLNAKDAMPDGGKITVKTSMLDCDTLFCSAHPDLKEGKYVVITISDSGTGIDKEHMERIFDPFFTTKEMGKGTGLGLSIVYGIIKNHNGYISCYSEVDIGTEFKIYLPSIGKVLTREEIKERTSKMVGGTETILVIDDEKPISELAKTILTRYGYTVFVCDNADTGLQKYKEKKDKIDIIILDLIMPGMSGTEALDKLIQIKSDVKVIVASGYSINGPVKDALSRGAKSFLSKPYTLKSLLGEVRKILDNKENGND